MLTLVIRAWGKDVHVDANELEVVAKNGGENLQILHSRGVLRQIWRALLLSRWMRKERRKKKRERIKTKISNHQSIQRTFKVRGCTSITC